MRQVDVDGDGQVEIRELLEAYGFALHETDAPMPTPPDVALLSSASDASGRRVKGRETDAAAAPADGSNCSVM